ncbi:MAG TPA: DUF488 domain-containing protein [Gemmatimonadaceae bacterium]|jgi:uncharacterized protein (DUF488 family)|nr:DUF488 domain-containing protein [Gemmatimonadaceae bacterium]
MTLIHTIGHSTRSLDELVALMRRHAVEHLADVRAHPGSRRYPHFSRDSLRTSLPALGIAYSHHPELGGRRRGLPDSPNGAWRNASFRAYADYMGTQEFAKALEALLGLAKGKSAAIMCAEAVPWRCHRWLISDALVARGIDVHHILDARSEPHSLTRFAELRDGTVVYPPESASASHPDLFD